MEYNNLRKDIISYIRDRMLDYDYHAKDFENMSEEELLCFVDGTVDTKPATGGHSYEIIPISSFNDMKQYEHYASMWCIFQSEEVFFEESHRGKCHFVLCKRDDADSYDRVTFGVNYPYDNYGLSFMALLLTKENRLVSVISRRNWDDDYGHYLSFGQLKSVLGEDLFNATINTNPLRILQISDTHCRHKQLADLPDADVIVHCGDFSEMGTEDEVLDFLNWFIGLPYLYKVFVTGNHDLCLWDADDIEDLPDNVYFLQDRDCEIEGIRFFGLAYNHSEKLIPNGVDVLVTHEPPVMILDESNNTHWGNVSLRNRVMAVKPHYHLFGHAHDAYGTVKQNGIMFFNGAIFDDTYEVCRKSKLFIIKDIYNVK